MTRAARLRRSDDIAAVRAEGRPVSREAFTARVRANTLGQTRLAVSAPRTVGSAVVRNRARRRVREAFRLAADAAPAVDAFVMVRREALEADFGALTRDARSTLQEARP